MDPLARAHRINHPRYGALSLEGNRDATVGRDGGGANERRSCAPDSEEEAAVPARKKFQIKQVFYIGTKYNLNKK